MGAYAGLGRVSVKPTTFEEYSKIKLGERNAKTLKRLGIKPLIKTIISRARMVEDGVHNPADKFPDFIKEALMAKGNPIMIRSIRPDAHLSHMEPRSPLWRERRGFFQSSSFSSFMNGTMTVPIKSPIFSVLLPPMRMVTPLSSPG